VDGFLFLAVISLSIIEPPRVTLSTLMWGDPILEKAVDRLEALRRVNPAIMDQDIAAANLALCRHRFSPGTA
jgi:hypothetical protein